MVREVDSFNIELLEYVNKDGQGEGQSDFCYDNKYFFGRT